MMSFSVVPAVIQFILLPCCPSSPRYLLIKLNKESLARQGMINTACSVTVRDIIFLFNNENNLYLELRKLQGTYNLEQVINEMKVCPI